MATGRAIIAADAPGSREIVIDNRNGFLVVPKSVDSLVEAMKRILEDREMASTIGVESRKLAEELFDVEKVNNVICSAMGLIV